MYHIILVLVYVKFGNKVKIAKLPNKIIVKRTMYSTVYNIPYSLKLSRNKFLWFIRL